MEKLTNHELLETYHKAKELKCSQDFLYLLEQEMEKRNLKQKVS